MLSTTRPQDETQTDEIVLYIKSDIGGLN